MISASGLQALETLQAAGPQPMANGKRAAEEMEPTERPDPKRVSCVLGDNPAGFAVGFPQLLAHCKLYALVVKAVPAVVLDMLFKRQPMDTEFRLGHSPQFHMPWPRSYLPGPRSYLPWSYLLLHCPAYLCCHALDRTCVLLLCPPYLCGQTVGPGCR